MSADLIGYVAGSLTTISFIPQAWKIIIHKKADGISLSMFTIFSIGVACWLIYGIIISSAPVIIFNVITLALVLLIIYKLLKLKNDGELA